jgi:hypothetical protein
MKGYVTALGLSLLLGAGGAAHAADAVVDFSDSTKNLNTTVVKNADGAVTEVKEGTVTAVKTSGADGTPGYLYVDVKDALFTAGKPLYIQVEYLDRGTDTWQLEYGTTDDPVALAQPVVQKNDTGAWKTITFKQVDADLQGGQDGKSDIRINDNGDGAEIIRRIIASDIDPQVVRSFWTRRRTPGSGTAPSPSCLTRRTRTPSSRARWSRGRLPAPTRSSGTRKGCTSLVKSWMPHPA